MLSSFLVAFRMGALCMLLTKRAALVECRLLKALSERLKNDAAEREAAKEFEITDSGPLPPTMRQMDAVQNNGAQGNSA